MFRVDTSGAVPELYLYGEISAPQWYSEPGETISAADVVEALANLKGTPELVCRINSPGGDVFEAVAIYQALARCPAKVRVEVDALAASAASVIACCGDSVTVAGNAMMMIHRAWTYASGNAEELGKIVESLQKVDESILATYATRCGTKCCRAKLEEMVAAETWLTAEECVQHGLADTCGDLKTVAAHVAPGRFRNTPRRLLLPAAGRRQPSPPPAPPTASQVPAISARLAEIRGRLSR